MKDSFLNKNLGIGIMGINCGCCIDYPKKRKNHKRCYRKLKRVILKVFTLKEIKEEIQNNDIL